MRLSITTVRRDWTERGNSQFRATDIVEGGDFGPILADYLDKTAKNIVSMQVEVVDT